MLIIDTAALARQVAEELERAGIIGWDIETVGVDPRSESPAVHGRVFCFTFAWRVNGVMHSAYVPQYRYPGGLEAFREVFESVKILKCAHNGWSFDRQVMANEGITVNGILDTFRMSWLLRADKTAGHGLKSLMVRDLKREEPASYASLFSRHKQLEIVEPAREIRSKRIAPGSPTREECKACEAKPLLDFYADDAPWKVATYEHAVAEWKLQFPRGCECVKPRKVPTLISGAASRIGKLEQIPLDEWIVLNPHREQKLIDYAVLDAVAALELHEHFKPMMQKIKTKYGTLYDLFYNEWSELSATLCAIERRGVLYDTKAAAEIMVGLDARLAEAQKELKKYPVNPKSPKALAVYLYDVKDLQVPPVCGGASATKRTPPGKRPTDFAALSWLAEHEPQAGKFVAALLEHKKASKLREFVVTLGDMAAGSNGRVHSVLAPNTDTGRLSSRNPNLQNIPKDGEARLRELFVATPGYLMVASDYSQLELYILAHALIKMFNDDRLYLDLQSGDVHSAVARRCWPLETQKLTDTQLRKHHLRNAAKAVVYGLNYGKGPGNLALGLGIEKYEAAAIIDAIKEAYGINNFQKRLQAQAQEFGYVSTILGRRRPLPHARLYPDTDEKRSLKAAALRQALNSPIQGSAADIVALAMNNLERDEKFRALGGRMILQIHDELLCEIPAEHAEEGKLLVLNAMENPREGLLTVRLVCNAHVGHNWAQCK